MKRVAYVDNPYQDVFDFLCMNPYGLATAKIEKKFEDVYQGMQVIDALVFLEKRGFVKQIMPVEINKESYMSDRQVYSGGYAVADKFLAKIKKYRPLTSSSAPFQLSQK